MLVAFDRMEGEPDDAWNALIVYRDLGMARTLERVSQLLTVDVGLLRQWAVTWRWTPRIRVWDEQFYALYEQEQKQRFQEMQDRHARLATQLLTLVEQRFRDFTPDHLTPSDVIRWLEIGVRVERQARGAPDLTTQTTQVQQVDVSKLSTEELEQLQRLLDKTHDAAE